MGIPLYDPPARRSIDKASSSPTCNTAPVNWNDDDHHETADRAWAMAAAGISPYPYTPARSRASATSQASSSSSSSSSSSASNGTSSTAVIPALTARDETSPAPPSTRRHRGSVSTSNNSNSNSNSVENQVLTLDEFLRETNAASAATNDAERHLQQTLRALHHSAADPWMGQRSLFDRAPGGGRVRLTPLMTTTTTTTTTAATGSSTAPASTTVSPPSPTSSSAGSLDSFDTLVTQIRRIGALQDVMLGGADSTPTASEDSTVGATADDASSAERERNTMSNLMIRQARLRAMQTRIDLLADEFEFLRNTRRELRRVEAQALEIQDSVNNYPDLRAERRQVRRAFLRQPEASTTAVSSNSSPGAAVSAHTPIPPPSVAPLVSTTAQRPVMNPRSLLPIAPPPPPPEIPSVQDEDAEQQSGSEQTTPTPTPGSVDRRSPVITDSERSLLLREAVMQMQIQSLSAGGR